MRGFALGLLVGVALGAAGMWAWVRREPPPEPAPVTEPVAAGPQPKPDRRRAKRPIRKRVAGAEEAAGGSADDEPLGATDDEPLPALTPGDRVLAWEGDEVSLPRQTFEGAEAGRPLRDEEVEPVLRAHERALLGCIRDARGGVAISGTVRLRALVDGGGRVTRSRVQAARWLIGQGVGACIRREAGRMRFPSTGAASLLELPFDVR